MGTTLFPSLSLYRMFGYNLAAAHLGLRHTVAHSFAVSDVYSGGEGWPLIDAIPAEDICHNFPPSEYPHVIHYCQHYQLGKVRNRYTNDVRKVHDVLMGSNKTQPLCLVVFLFNDFSGSLESTDCEKILFPARHLCLKSLPVI
jgi:hypothetical protein